MAATACASYAAAGDLPESKKQIPGARQAPTEGRVMMPTSVRKGFVDTFSPDFFSDPYDAFAEARDHLPVQCYESGTWMVFRHDDVVQVLRDRGLSSTELYTLDAPRNRAILAAGGTEAYLLRPSLSKMDAPDHTPLRSMLARLFTPRAGERLRAAAVTIVTNTLDRHAGGDIELIN